MKTRDPRTEKVLDFRKDGLAHRGSSGSDIRNRHLFSREGAQQKRAVKGRSLATEIVDVHETVMSVGQPPMRVVDRTFLVPVQTKRTAMDPNKKFFKVIPRRRRVVDKRPSLEPAVS